MANYRPKIMNLRLADFVSETICDGYSPSSFFPIGISFVYSMTEKLVLYCYFGIEGINRNFSQA